MSYLEKFTSLLMHGFWFLECCVEIRINFHEDEFEKHHESPLVGIYRMTGLNVKNNYVYKHQPGLHKLSRQTDWNWKVVALTHISRISIILVYSKNDQSTWFHLIIPQFLGENWRNIQYNIRYTLWCKMCRRLLE